MRRVALAGILVGLTFVAAPGRACFNVTRAEVDANVKKVQTAAATLDAGDLPNTRRVLKDAIRFLQGAKLGTHPDGKLRNLKDEPVDPPDPGLLRRAIRIDALAQSRAPKASDADRQNAVSRFESEVLDPKTTPDPALLADHAELLSRVDARKGQATMMLRTLRDKDLMGSAHAYAALARLEKDAGDAEAERQARERCKTMTPRPAICL